MRYAISFFLAWLVSALVSDFPFFRNLIKSIKLDSELTNLMIFTTEGLLNIFGFATSSNGNFLTIIGAPGVTFAYGCLGFRELSFFIVFIIFQSGEFKHKAWYIPSGIVLLILLNVIRVVIIVWQQYLNPDSFQFVHDTVSPIIMYPAIFFLWIFWVNIFGKQK